jgi:hypothetical protein
MQAFTYVPCARIGTCGGSRISRKSPSGIPNINTAPEQAVGAESFSGEIEGHAYSVNIETDDVLVQGRGWQIILPEAPRYRHRSA